MNPETIKKLAALCTRWEALDKERTDIETQIAQLTASQPVADDDEIRVGDLVEVVSANGSWTYKEDIGRGGTVRLIYPDGGLEVSKSSTMLPPLGCIAHIKDCRKVKRS